MQLPWHAALSEQDLQGQPLREHALARGTVDLGDMPSGRTAEASGVAVEVKGADLVREGHEG